MQYWDAEINAEVQSLRRLLIDRIKMAFTRDFYLFDERYPLQYIDAEGDKINLISIEALNGNPISIRKCSSQGVYNEPLEMQTVDILISILKTL